MVSAILVTIALSLIIVFWLHQKAISRPTNFPPGPPKLPIWGSYWYLLLMDYQFLNKSLLRLGHLYKTKILGVFLGSFPTIVVNSHEDVKALFLKPEFSGRPDVIMARLRDPNLNLHGVFFTDGPLWHEQRRFALRHMRDFGFGRRSKLLEDVISEEIMDMVELLRDGPQEKGEDTVVNNGCARMPDLFYAGFVNSFMYIVSGRRTPRKEHWKLQDAARGGLSFGRNGDDLGLALSYTPWLARLAPDFSRYNNLKKGNQFLYDFIKNSIDENTQSYQENDRRNFYDIYVSEMKKRQENNEESTFSYDQMVLLTVDFLLPSSTGAPTQIAFLVRFLLNDPELQTNIQEEIDKVVGRGRLPTLDDRIHMPYTEASLRECMRRETLVSLSIPHRAVVDTEFMGYDVPKNTVMVPNLWAAHMDPDVWGDPERFRPERFLDSRGALKKKDLSMPFGAGKRLCAGETFARQTMFLFVAGLLQNFTLSVPEGHPVPDVNTVLPGIIVTPSEFWVKITAR